MYDVDVIATVNSKKKKTIYSQKRILCEKANELKSIYYTLSHS